MNISKLKNYLSAFKCTGRVSEIKLRDILETHRNEFGLKKYHAMFPPVEIGSITLVDQIVLVGFLDLLQPKEILEIGTYKGYTARLLLDNSGPETLIKSVDLPVEKTENIDADDIEQALQNGDYNDDFLRREQLKDGAAYLSDISDDQYKRLTLIKADSTKLDYSAIFENLSYAFIDGGHDYETVRTDTEKVLAVMKEGLILWHDYASDIHSDVTRYLNEEVAIEREVFHVKGSLLAFTIIA